MSDAPRPRLTNSPDHPLDRPGATGPGERHDFHDAERPPAHSTRSGALSSATNNQLSSDNPASTELISVLLSTPDVEGFLTQTATIAANSSPSRPSSPASPADATGMITGRDDGPARTSCGITLQRDGHPLTVGSSDDLAGAVDEAQYADEQGPCLLALQTGAIVSAPDLATDTRWPAYTARALTYGIASSLSLPLLVDAISVGAMNLYSPAPGTFEDPAVMGHARSLAAQASVTLAVVLRQTRQADLTESLRATLASRSVIDQAIGLLMGQQRCDAAAAFALLRAASQHRNRKLRDVAADVIAAAASRPGPRT